MAAPSRIVIVPGLAVRTYAEGPARAVQARGHTVDLLRAPAWRGTPTDLVRYGRVLAERLDRWDEQVDLLVGLSVGTQAAAVAAATGGHRIRRLLLVSPTVDPIRRGRLRLIRDWLGGDPHDDAPGFVDQLPDWARADPARIVRGLDSAVRVHLETVLAGVRAPVTIVHAEHDSLGRRSWAESLARQHGARWIERPDAPHSWPVADDEAFADLVDELLDEAGEDAR